MLGSITPSTNFSAKQPLTKVKNDVLGFVPHDTNVDGYKPEVISAFPERYDFNDRNINRHVVYRLGENVTESDAIREAKRIAGNNKSKYLPGMATVYRKENRYWVSPADQAVWSDHSKPNDIRTGSLYNSLEGDPVRNVARTSKDLVAVVSGDSMADFRGREIGNSGWGPWRNKIDYVQTKKYSEGAPQELPFSNGTKLATAALPYTDDAYISATLSSDNEIVRLGHTSFDDAVTSARLLAANLDSKLYAVVRDKDGARWVIGVDTDVDKKPSMNPDFEEPSSVTIPRSDKGALPEPISPKYYPVIGVTNARPDVEAIIGERGLVDLHRI